MPTIICDDYKIEITRTSQIKRQKILTKKEKDDQKNQQYNEKQKLLKKMKDDKKIKQYNEKRELRKDTLMGKIRVAQIQIKQLKGILEKEKQVQKEIKKEEKCILKSV